MRVLVTGASGQLGTDLVEVLERAGETPIPATRADADFADPPALRALVSRERPDAVVNCAAFHDVAGCETQPELARLINATAVEALAEACGEVGAKLLTVSTDYVFDGAKAGGYVEADEPNPLNAYGASKLEGEQRALAAHPQTFVVRSQSLFGLAGPSGKGKNFVELMLSLAEDRDELKVDQFRMAPTATAPLAREHARAPPDRGVRPLPHELRGRDDLGRVRDADPRARGLRHDGDGGPERLLRDCVRAAGALVPDQRAAPRARPRPHAELGRRARGLPAREGEGRRGGSRVKILAVGGAGYVGSSLVPALVERGYEVDVIDLKWFGVHLPEGVSVVDSDVLRCHVEDVAGYEQVIFLAGLSNDPMAEFDPAMNFVANAAVPSYLAYLAKMAGVRRMIYASSCSVYGYTVNQLYDETAPVASSYPYGISKLQGEQGVLQMGDDEFSVIALRKGTICGYSPRMRFDLIVNTMYKACIQDGKIVVNNASLWRPILDMRDAVAAYLRAIQADYSVSGVFNIASDNYTVGQVGDMVKDEMERLLEQAHRPRDQAHRGLPELQGRDREGANRPRLRAQPRRHRHDRGPARAPGPVRGPRRRPVLQHPHVPEDAGTGFVGARPESASADPDRAKADPFMGARDAVWPGCEVGCL